MLPCCTSNRRTKWAVWAFGRGQEAVDLVTARKFYRLKGPTGFRAALGLLFSCLLQASPDSPSSTSERAARGPHRWGSSAGTQGTR